MNYQQHKRWIVVIGMLVLMALVSISPLNAAQGDLDTSFGQNSYVDIELSPAEVLSWVTDVAFTSDQDQRLVDL